METTTCASGVAPPEAISNVIRKPGEPDSASLTASVLARISEINAEHQLAGRAAKDAVAHARRCGELLNETKRSLPHGAFMRWVQTHCEFAVSTAGKYMALAKNPHAGAISSIRHLYLSGRRIKEEDQKSGLSSFARRQQRQVRHDDAGEQTVVIDKTLQARSNDASMTVEKALEILKAAGKESSLRGSVRRYRRDVTRHRNALRRAELELHRCEAAAIEAAQAVAP